MPITITAANAVPDDAEVVGVPVAEGSNGPEVVGGGAAAAGVDVDALIARLVAESFDPKVGATALVAGLGDDDAPSVIAVGMGDTSALTLDVLRRASAAVVRAAWKRTSVATLVLDAAPAELHRGSAAQAVAEGAALAAYRFTRFKSDPDACTIEAVTVVGKGGKPVAAGVERGATIAGGVALARDLVNTPPGHLSPVAFADIAVETAGAAGIEVEVIDEKQAAKMGLGGIAGVGQGSDNPPRLVKLTYTPEGKARGHVALVGKGITFDSGGLSLKTGEGMMTMKTDMSGAAAVLATMSILPALAPKVAVTAFLCLAENMPSGSAIRPGDVLKIRNGTTVEVLNTDAEGRLVLADGLSLAAEEGVDAIVDLATLTGACLVALGPTIAGLMGNHDGWVDAVGEAAGRAGETVWHLPLPGDYRKMLDSDIADLKNIGGKHAGALPAGLFLQEFVGDVPWVHLDIAGPASVEEDQPHVPKGGTGFGVRTLIEALAGFAKPKGRGQTARQEPTRA
ncbi:MAG TPA: leucyl aminopeptidase [Acidimicrobiales bacterium]|nr:leucyl aminopeptidase [Acidimicrobiales bacterium]